MFISGRLLAELKDFKLFVSDDTGDYLAPYVVPPPCLVSARRRLDGFNELEAPEVLERSGLHEHPAEYFVATGQVKIAVDPTPAAGPARSKRPPTPPQKARGSADQEPQERSSRGSGAGTPRLRLKKAPRHKPKVETPPSSPKGVPDWTSKQQDEVCGSTREAEIADFDPERTARLNKKTYKIPQQPKDEQPEEEE